MYRKFFFSMLILCHFASLLTAQQQYSNESISNCNSTDKTGPSPTYLYACNSPKRSCQAYLIYRTQDSYDSATDVSNLTSSVLPELSRINNISSSERLRLGSEVIVPVNCSCSGKSYQATTSYTIQNEFETYFTIAKDTFEGLSSCNALIQENPYDAFSLEAGLNLRIPLRCACPTQNQTSEGIKFLVTHSVSGNDSISDLSQRFNVTVTSVLEANGFSEEDPTLNPLTTILIPLRDKPLSSQTRFYSPPPPPPPLPTPARRRKVSRKGIYLGIAIGGSLGVLCCVLFLLLMHGKEGKIPRIFLGNKQRKDVKHLTQNIKQKISNFDQDLKIYGFEELEAATKGFCSQQKLCDSVYHGVLRGKSVAVKKTSRDVKKEVKILQRIRHFNLLSLYGVCEHNGLFYLAYEFMENGSLRQWINQEDNPENQSWNIRIRMALDVANGLDYLHNFIAPGYVHKDINSGNVLVNSDLRAKIANFSFAKSPGNSMSFACSSSFQRLETNGYMAPEFLEDGEVTPEIDVYAFGVILLELITGKDAIFMKDGHEVLLSEVALSVMSAANADAAAVGDFIDSKLQEKHPLGFIIDHSQLALRLLELSVTCLAIDPSKRPAMAAVISSLLKIQLDVENEYSFSVQ